MAKKRSRRLSQVEKDKIVALHEKGLTQTQISQRVKRARSTVARVVREESRDINIGDERLIKPAKKKKPAKKAQPKEKVIRAVRKKKPTTIKFPESELEVKEEDIAEPIAGNGMYIFLATILVIILSSVAYQIFGGW